MLRSLYNEAWLSLILEAGTYWQSYSETFSWWKMKNILSKLFEDELRKTKRPRFKILDVGCGKGTDIFMLNALFSNSYDLSFTGIDISRYVIEFAKELAERRGHVNCIFAVGDAENLEFKAENFDIVISSELLEHLPNPTKALMEIRRVLRNDGAAIITTPNELSAMHKFTPERLQRKIAYGAKRDLSLRTEDVALALADAGHTSVKTCKEWCRIVKEVGFKIEELKRGSLVYGGSFFDKNPTLFSMILTLDSILNHVPFAHGFSWSIVLKVRKVEGRICR